VSVFLLVASLLASAGWATASHCDAYPLERVSPAAWRVRAFSTVTRTARCNFVRTHPLRVLCAQSCPRQGRGDTPLALNPSRRSAAASPGVLLMSTYTRTKTKAQRRHPGSRGKSHKKDKRLGEARRETAWVGVEAPQHPSPQRSFGDLTGHEYLYADGEWKRCDDPEAFADYLEAEAERRSWYMGRTTRQGVAVDMRRPVAAPVEVLTTSFAPWLSDWTAAEIVAKRDPRKQLAAIRNRWLEAVQTALAGQRYLLGYAFHADTDDPHFDLCASRQDGAGGRIGEPGLRLVGPWCTAVDRQLRAGAEIHADKRRQMKRSVANFRHRYGADAKPLDVELARALDGAADAVLGAELIPFREAYARSVPELERQHTAAQLAALEAAEEKLRERLTPEPSASEPEPEREMPEPEPNLPPL
jgi:hypothetical protein